VRKLGYAIVDGTGAMVTGAGELVRAPAIGTTVYELIPLARRAHDENLAAELAPHEDILFFRVRPPG
jgi:hypothetical protein